VKGSGKPGLAIQTLGAMIRFAGFQVGVPAAHWGKTDGFEGI
jgi:hypothetical protein